MTEQEIMEAVPMTEKDVIAAVHELPEAQQCYITRTLLAEHIIKHGTAILNGYQPPAWVKWVWGAVAAVLGAVATASLTSCTVSPATAAQVQAVDALFHRAAPYILTIEPIKK